MAFELGKTGNGAKYVMGQNGKYVYLTQASISIKQKSFDGSIRSVVYVVNQGMEPIYCGELDNLFYMGSPINNDPEIAIDFLKNEGWITYNESGSVDEESEIIYTKDYSVDVEIESGVSLPISIPFAELVEGFPYSISFAGVPTALIINWTISESGFIDVDFSNTSPVTIPFHNTITITVKK